MSRKQQHIDIILSALYERRARLIAVDRENSGVIPPARPNLRTRINEVNDAIRFVKGELHV